MAIFASAMFAACSSDTESMVADLNDAIKAEDKSEVFDLAKDLCLTVAQMEVAAKDMGYLTNVIEAKELLEKADKEKLEKDLEKELTSMYEGKIADFEEVAEKYLELLAKAKSGEVDAMIEIAEGAEEEYNDLEKVMNKIIAGVDDASKAKIAAAKAKVATIQAAQ